MGATIYDLEEAELCYAPQFGSAKDAVNFAGMVAADVLRGDMPLAHWADVQDGFLLDVRQPVSYTHLRAHETVLDLVCRLLLEKKNIKQQQTQYTM